jgi:hypothetical protein
MATQSIRRSVALSKRLVDEVSSVAPAEFKGNWNRLVVAALQEFARNRRREQFEQSMAKMAKDPAIRKECAAIGREFAHANRDGLADD